MPRHRSLHKHKKFIKNAFLKFMLSRFETQLDNLCTKKELEKSVTGYYSRRTKEYEIRIDYTFFDYSRRFLLKFEFYRISTHFSELRDFNRSTGSFRFSNQNALILNELNKENLLKPFYHLPD